jgi:hypothetical protein
MNTDALLMVNKMHPEMTPEAKVQSSEGWRMEDGGWPDTEPYHPYYAKTMFHAPMAKLQPNRH